MRAEKGRSIVPILGINVDSTSMAGVLKWVKSRLKRRNYSLVVTPNPEIVLEAASDHDLARIINQADLALPDGRGLAWAAMFLYNRRIKVVPGRIVFRKLVCMAQQKGLRVFFLGGKDKVAEHLASYWADKSPTRHPLRQGVAGWQIEGATGPWLNRQGKPINLLEYQVEKDIVKRINSFAPHFLFVGFGPPKQEKWLARNLPHLNVKIAMVVGGAFDYYSGKYPLPPKFFEKAGLEWFWRLLTQPWRAKRIFNAVVVFPLKVFLTKFLK